MTAPGGGVLKVNPADLHGAAQDWRGGAEQISSGSQPDQLGGDWPDQKSTHDLNSSVAAHNQGMSNRLGGMADATSSAADLYTKQDQQSAGSLSQAVDLGDIASLIQVGTQFGAQALNSFSSFAGQLAAAGTTGMSTMVSGMGNLAGQFAKSPSTPTPASVAPPAPGGSAGAGGGSSSPAVTPAAGLGPAPSSTGKGEPEQRDHLAHGGQVVPAGAPMSGGGMPMPLAGGHGGGGGATAKVRTARVVTGEEKDDVTES